MPLPLATFEDLPVEIGELIFSLCDDDVLTSLARTSRYLNWRLVPILLLRRVQIDIRGELVKANWWPEDIRRMYLLDLLNLWVWKPSLPNFQYTFFGSSYQKSVAEHETGTIIDFIERLASVDTLFLRRLDNLLGATSDIRKHDSDTWRLNLVRLLKAVLHKHCRRLTLDHGPMSTYIHEPIPGRFTAAQARAIAARTSFVDCFPSLEVLHLRDSMMLLPFFLPHTLDLLRSQSSTLVELMIYEDSIEGWKDFFASVSAPLLQELVIKRKSFEEPSVVPFDILFSFFRRHPALRRLKLDHICMPKAKIPPYESTPLFPNLEYLDAHPTILATLLRYSRRFMKLSYVSVSLPSYDGFFMAIPVLSSEIKYSILNRSKPIHLSFGFNAGQAFVSWFRHQVKNPVFNPLQYLTELEELTIVIETTRFGEMISFLQLVTEWLWPLSNLKLLRVGYPYHVDVFRRELRRLKVMRPSLRIRLFDSLDSICGDRGLFEEEFDGNWVRGKYVPRGIDQSSTFASGGDLKLLP